MSTAPIARVQARRFRSWLHPGIPLLVAAAIIALVATGCDSSSGQAVAQTGATPTAAAPPSSGAQSPGSGIAFSACMRKHGLPDSPDPNSQGAFLLKGGQGSDLDPNSPTFQAAQQACQKLAPAGTASVSPAQIAQMRSQALKFSACMRKHGLKDFPDPNSQGGLFFKSGGPGTGLDPNSPQFQAAQHACQSLSPFHVGGAP